MKRREFIGLVGGAALWSLPASSQKSERMHKIGILWALPANDPQWDLRVSAIRTRLRELGWTDDSKLPFEVRPAIGNRDELVSLANELIQAKVEVILVHSAGLAAIVQTLTRTIPIITTTAGVLEGTGLIKSLSEPGGNVTGMQLLNPDLMSKRLELLKQLLPRLTRVGVFEPTEPAAIRIARYFEVVNEAAHAIGASVDRFPVERPEEFTGAFARMTNVGVHAAIVIATPVSVAYRKEIAAAAAVARMPTIYEARPFVTAGGLISYGPEILQLHRDAANFIDKVLRGVPPGELPVQQPTVFEMIINLKTAKDLGVTIPPALLARADELID